MKKTLKGFFVAFAVMLVTAIGCGIAVYAQREQVDVEESIRYGELSAAHGITMDMRTTLEKHLFWDMEIPVGGACESEYTFFAEEHVEEWDREYDGGIQLSLNFSTSGSHDLLSGDGSRLIGNINDMLLDVASRTSLGKTHTETVNLSDYYAYVPYELEDDGHWLSEQEAENMQAVLAYFKVPTPENLMVEITIEKDVDGNVYSVLVNNASEMDIEAFRLWEMGDVRYAVPCGYGDIPTEMQGIHRITVTGDDATGYVMSNPEMFYPLPEGTEYLEFTESADGESLFFLGRNDGAVTLTVIDTATGTEVTHLDIPVLPQEYDWYRMEVEEDFLVLFFADGTMHLVTWENGDYQIVMSDCTDDYREIPQWQEEDLAIQLIYTNSVAMEYDGTRLAIALTDDYVCQNATTATLVVFEDSGLTFVADYAINQPPEKGSWSGSVYSRIDPIGVSIVA